MANVADIQRYLGDIDYPVNKDQLIDHASNQGATEDVIQTLSDLPADQFNSASDVSKAMGSM